MSWMAAAFAQFWGVLWKWKWVYLVPVATLILPATIYALRLPDTYDAVAVVQIQEKVSRQTRTAGPTTRDESSFETVVKSRDRLLSMENVKALVPILAPDADPTNPDLLQKLASRIEWNRISDSSFSVKCTDIDPIIAMRAANAITERMLETEKLPKIHEAAKKHEHAIKHLKEARDSFEVARDALRGFQRLHQGKGISELELKRMDDELKDLRTRGVAVRSRIREIEKEQADISAELARGPTSAKDVKDRSPSVLESRLDTELGNLLDKLAEARTELITVRATRTERAPRVISALAKVNDLQSAISEIETKLDAERTTQVNRWRSQLALEGNAGMEARRDRLAVIGQGISTQEALGRELEAAEDKLFRNLQAAPELQQQLEPYAMDLSLANEMLKEAATAEVEAEEQLAFRRTAPASIITPFQIVQPAVAPVDPTGPSRMRYLVLAIAAGLLLGYGLMLLRRRFDDATMLDAKDVAGMLPGALVVEVPRLEEGPLIPARSVARDLVFGAWVVGCFGVTALAVAANRGMVEAPAWLQRLLQQGGA